MSRRLGGEHERVEVVEFLPNLNEQPEQVPVAGDSTQVS